ncbi:MAG: ER protein Pkr1-domain-containing protein, partial [Piptocephalis tieghemiana]
MLEQVISSIFTPGTNPGLVKATNRAFMALFASLLFLLAVSGGNLHVVALLVIAGCLYGSIQWFITEL